MAKLTNSDKSMFGFSGIIITSVLWPSLPNISLIALVSLLFIFVCYKRLSATFAGIIAGFIWISIVGHYYTNSIENDQYFSQSILVRGTVLNLSTLPLTTISPKLQKTKLNLRIVKIGNKSLHAYPSFLQPIVRITWYKPTFGIQQGDKVQFLVKLKPPVGLANLGGFNYQKWLVGQNIHALGYIKNSPSNKLLHRSLTTRQTLVNQLEASTLNMKRFILALSYGDRRLLTDEDWTLLQETGTAHLFAISGMHLGAVFGCVLLVLKSFMTVFVSTTSYVFKDYQLSFNFKPFILFGTLILCLFYAELAGFQIPIMRAWLTFSILVLLVVFKKHWQVTSIILAMLCIFFILFPLSILSLSFWFSVTSVWLILLYVWRFPLPHHANLKQKLIYILKLQIYMSFATLPFAILTFGTLPLSALLANLFMIPVVTFILLPLCLLATICCLFQLPSMWLYEIIDIAFSLSIQCLIAINLNIRAWLNSVFDNSFNVFDALLIHFTQLLSQPLFYILVVTIVLPKMASKNLLIFLFASTLLVQSLTDETEPKSDKSWQFHAFDVGQGSSYLVKSNNQVLLYDTGMQNHAFSMANAVLLPYLKYANIPSLKYLILSHLDNDHSGGANTISKAFKVEQTLSPSNGCNRAAYFNTQENAKQYINLPNLKVAILWPIDEESGEHNNHSCVVKISSEHHSVLLTGDIEVKAEKQMLEYYALSNILQSTVLVAPHHGSKTSSSQAFIEAVNPQYVVFSAGFNNRWNHPSNEVVERFKNNNINMFNTGLDGQLIFTFEHKSNQPVKIQTYRNNLNKKWYLQVPESYR